jgi:hypothetical protein
MAEHAQYPIDVVELWGPEGESGLTPAAPFTPAPDLYPVDTKHTNGNGESTPGVDNQALDEVARLAAALAANHSDVVRMSDLDAMRTDMERAFSQQLAVGLYELVSTWNSRFAAAEDHISERVTRSVDAQAGILRSSIEANHHAVLEIAEMVRSELAAFRGQLTGVEGLTSFQRDIRHDVARLGDLASMPPAVSAETGDLSETMRVMRAELAELRQEIFRLRGSMAVPAPAE